MRMFWRSSAGSERNVIGADFFLGIVLEGAMMMVFFFTEVSDERLRWLGVEVRSRQTYLVNVFMLAYF